MGSQKTINRLVLIDGNAITHRAYHALPPLTNGNGELLNAVYGFCTMILKVITDLKPKYLAVTFDTPKPTFRKMEYIGYQAKRPEMDAELSGQFPRINEVVTAMGIPIYQKEGYEADDVIGTIAKKALEDAKMLSEKDTKKKDKKSPSRVSQSSAIDEVVIVTGDRDILQLVDDKTKVYMPVKGLSETRMYDSSGVLERMEVLPNLIIDYKGLVGDSSDNYPGVAGIGPKTAVNLLNHFGSFENIYNDLGGVERKFGRNVREKLVRGKELGFLSRKLATIIRDVPMDFSLERCTFQFTDEERERTLNIFKDLGFRSLVGRLKGGERREKKESKRNNSEGQLELI